MEGVVRTVGIVLVALGAIALGWEGFSYVTTDGAGGEAVRVAREETNTVRVPPVVSGIALVTGLILLASNGRRDEV